MLNREENSATLARIIKEPFFSGTSYTYYYQFRLAAFYRIVIALPISFELRVCKEVNATIIIVVSNPSAVVIHATQMGGYTSCWVLGRA